MVRRLHTLTVNPAADLRDIIRTSGPWRGVSAANTGKGPGHGVVWDVVGAIRQCSRSACRQSAVATLTYVYADSTAVLGPLATYAEPHCYDLCEQHAGSLTVPRGWEVLRLAMPSTPQQPGPDDLLALANAVREAGARPASATQPQTQRSVHSALEAPPAAEGARRGHLRVLREPS